MKKVVEYECWIDECEYSVMNYGLDLNRKSWNALKYKMDDEYNIDNQMGHQNQECGLEGED